MTEQTPTKAQEALNAIGAQYFKPADKDGNSEVDSWAFMLAFSEHIDAVTESLTLYDQILRGEVKAVKREPTREMIADCGMLITMPPALVAPMFRICWDAAPSTPMSEGDGNG